MSVHIVHRGSRRYPNQHTRESMRHGAAAGCAEGPAFFRRMARPLDPELLPSFWLF